MATKKSGVEMAAARAEITPMQISPPGPATARQYPCRHFIPFRLPSPRSPAYAGRRHHGVRHPASSLRATKAEAYRSPRTRRWPRQRHVDGPQQHITAAMLILVVEAHWRNS